MIPPPDLIDAGWLIGGAQHWLSTVPARSTICVLSIVGSTQ
jgi:hypothetical protein